MGIPLWNNKEFLNIIKYGIFTNNSAKKKYELLIKQSFGMKYCFFTDLGRQAITLALMGLGVNKGDEVIVPSFVCQNVVAPIVFMGATPRYVDIDDDYNISPESVKQNICDKTSVIIVPHLFGKVARIKEIQTIACSRGIPVIDDAAQSVGAKINDRYIGTFGDIGILSFGPFKSITATRGGALLLNDDMIYEKIKKIEILNHRRIPLIRGLKSIIKFKMRKFSLPLISKINQHSIYGKKKPQSLAEFFKTFTSESTPCNIDLMDLSIIKCQLDKLPSIISKRKQLGIRLTKLLSEQSWFKTNNHFTGENIFVKYIINLEKLIPKHAIIDVVISKVLIFLNSRGIEAHSAYIPMHQNKRLLVSSQPYLKNTEDKAPGLICLPINHDMKLSDIDFIASCINCLPEII
ncbi:dTDP-4-amino-4,6-dideoxygalactose transaminase [Desulfobacula phenolica]|uniref:dTDP-4-amino-4,6-dideoxygalactose transaminase n=2 Tax=Desulfobacula phenolica TaxID=90732 RepID=A0A1H2EP80_9BACT|nr:dTDP-4-amino-4,6-dideoxygalactose transaminase [Desulfobacula phenolica]